MGYRRGLAAVVPVGLPQPNVEVDVLRGYKTMGRVGVEPTRGYKPRGILSPLRLPFRHRPVSTHNTILIA